MKKYGLLNVLFYILVLLLPVVAFATWAIQTSGTASDLYDVDFVNANHGWIVGGKWYVQNDAVILHTTNGGTIWTNQTPSSIPGGIDALSGVSFVDTMTGWAVGIDTLRCSLILKTTNGGLTWLRQSAPIDTPSPVSVCFVNANNGWTSPGGPYTMAFQQAIFHTTNGGNSWSIQGWDNYDGGSARIFFPDLQYGFVAGGTEMTPTTRGYIMRTINGGVNWGESYHWGATIPYTWPMMTGVHFPIDHFSGWGCGNLYAMGDEYELRIVRTTDGGSNWDEVQVIDNLEVGMLQDIHMVDLLNGWVVGEGGDILRTTDGFNTWHFDTSGVSETMWAVDFVDLDNGWAVGSSGRILKYSSPGGGADESSREAAANIGKKIEFGAVFAANYDISFWFSSADEEAVTFSICNTLGQRMIIEKKNVPAGRTYHRISLPGNLPCGIYFLQAEVAINDEVITEKFIFLK